MHSLRTQVPFLFSCTLILLLVSSASAQNLQGVKVRMLDRKSTISTLMGQGIIGEGNDGYLHLRKAANDAKKVVSSENADRRVVYETIAKKEGVSVGNVGKRRAIQIAGIAKPGHWLQKKDGTWYRK